MKITQKRLRQLIKEELEAMQTEAPLGEEHTLSEEDAGMVEIPSSQAAKIKDLAYQLYNATMNMPTSPENQEYRRSVADYMKNR